MSSERWSEFPIVTTLPDASFLALIDFTQILDDQNQTITSLDAKIYFQETLVTNVAAGGFSIDGLGSVSFDNLLTSITQSSDDLLYDVDTDGVHIFRFADSEGYTFSDGQADFKTNDIFNVSRLNFLDFTTWIDQNSEDMRFNVTTNGEFTFRVDGTNVFRVSDGGMNFTQRNATNVARISFAVNTTSIQQIVSDLTFKTVTGGSYNFQVANSDEYIFDAAQADFLTNNIVNLGILSFTNTATSLQQDSLNLQYDVAEGGSHVLRIFDDTLVIDVDEYNFNSVRADFLGNHITNVDFFQSNAGNVASGGTVRLGNGEIISWRNNAGDGNETIHFDTNDELVINIAATAQYVFSSSEADFKTNDIINLGDLNGHTIPTGTDDFVTLNATQELTNKTLDSQTNDLIGNFNDIAGIGTQDQNLDMGGFSIFAVADLTLSKTLSTRIITLARDEILLDATTIGQIQFQSKNSIGNLANYAKIDAIMESDNGSNEQGSLHIRVMDTAITNTEYMSFNDVGSGLIKVLKTTNFNSQDITNAVLVSPFIDNFTNANHDHTAGAGGGQLTNDALATGVFNAIVGIGEQTEGLLMGANFIDNVSEITFGNLNTSVSRSTDNLLLDADDGGSIVMRVYNDTGMADVVEYTFSATQADFLGNNIVNLGAFDEDIEIIQDGSAASFNATTYSTVAATHSQFTGSRADGTLSVPDAVDLDDVLCSLRALGYDGTTFELGGFVEFVADGTWTTISHPTRYAIYTTPVDTIVPLNQFEIGADGTADFKTNDLASITSISFGDLETTITHTADDLLYDVNADGEHIFQVDGSNVAKLGDISLNLLGLNLIGVGFVDIAEIATPATPNANTGRIFMNDDGFGVTKPFLIDSTGLVSDVIGRPLPANTFYVNSEAELQAIFPSSIITSNATIFFDSSMTLTTGITIDTDVTVEFIAEPNIVVITLNSTDTLFSTVGGAQGLLGNACEQVRVSNINLVGNNIAQLFDIQAKGFVICELFTAFNFASLGNISALVVNLVNSNCTDYAQGLLFVNCGGSDVRTLLFNQTTGSSLQVTAMRVFNPNGGIVIFKAFDITLSDIGGSDTVFFLDPYSDSDSKYIISGTTTTSPSSGIELFSAQPPTLPSRTIDSVSGFAGNPPTTFNTSVEHDFRNGDVVTISGYITNIDYNDTFVISGITSFTPSTFVVESLDFGTDEAGGSAKLIVASVISSAAEPAAGFTTFTSTLAHGLRIGDMVVLADFVNEETYNATFIVTDVDTPLTGLTFTVALEFENDDDGTFSVTSLDSTDILVTAQDNPGFKNSMTTVKVQSAQGTDFVVDNDTETFVPIQNTVPIIGQFVLGDNAERFTIDTSTGVITYIGKDPITAFFTYQLSGAPNSGAVVQQLTIRAFVNTIGIPDTDFQLTTSNSASVFITVNSHSFLALESGDEIQLYQRNDLTDVDTKYRNLLYTLNT